MSTAATDLDIIAPHEKIRISDFYEPWAHQEAFHLSGAKYRLQVGSFGSGKSRPLLMEGILHAEAVPGSNNIILRKTIPDLKRTVIDKFLADIPKGLYERGSQQKGTYNQSDHIVYWPPVLQWNEDGTPKIGADGEQEYRQSKLYFGACERIEDVSKFLSTEFLFVGFEELGEFPFPIWDAFAGRNRCPIRGSRPCMAGSTNPMGIGWGWIKKLFIDKQPVFGMDPDKYKPRDYWFIHSTVDQNPIYAEDKEYIEKLEASPLRDKIRWGRLDSVTGQYFDNWDPANHILPAESFLFEPWNPVWVGWDYGFGHYATITFWTKATLKPRLPVGEFSRARIVNVCIGELVLHEMTIEEQGQQFMAMLPQIGKTINMRRLVEQPLDADDAFEPDERDDCIPAPISSIHFSWERFMKTSKRNGIKRSVSDDLGDLLALNNIVRPLRSNTDRVAGWSKIYSLLDRYELFLLRGACPLLAEAIPLAVRGDGISCSLEDVVKPKGLSLEDDLNDSARYAVAGVLLEEEGEKPDNIKLRDKLAGIKDPMRRHVEMYKHFNKQKAQERRGPVGPTIPSWVNRVKGQP